MINQMNTNDHTENQFFHALKELQIAKLLRRTNITKSCGVSAYEVFQFLLLLVFQGKNLFRFLNSKHKEQAVSKNTYYRFLNEVSYNWSRFLMLLAVKVTSAFDRLTRPERVNVLILDDSVIKRNRSKKVELDTQKDKNTENTTEKQKYTVVIDAGRLGEWRFTFRADRSRGKGKETQSVKWNEWTCQRLKRIPAYT